MDRPNITFLRRAVKYATAVWFSSRIGSDRTIGGGRKKVRATAKRMARRVQVLHGRLRSAVRDRMEIEILFYFPQNIDVDILLLQTAGDREGIEAKTVDLS